MLHTCSKSIPSNNDGISKLTSLKEKHYSDNWKITRLITSTRTNDNQHIKNDNSRCKLYLSVEETSPAMFIVLHINVFFVYLQCHHVYLLAS